MTLNQKVNNLVTKLSSELYEREDAIRLSFLALMAGESIFFLGPPGVAKSLISRQIKTAIKDAKHFEYLMNRFSTPEEIFGPISLKKLDEDKYERKIEGYLPTADVAFLDEIWKASPSIQNTLLTIINEKIFRNGSNDLNVPLQILISASNELPASGEGLEALYDRFLIRMYVDNVSNNDSFLKMVDGRREITTVVTESEKLTIPEIVKARNEIQDVTIPKEIGAFIIDLKKQLKLKLEARAPYISDRRWKKIVWLLKTSAHVSGRKEIDFIDLILIPNFIWENTDHIIEIKQVFDELWYEHSVAQFGFSIDNIHKTMQNFINAIEGERKTSKVDDENEKQDSQTFEIVKLRDSSSNLSDYMVFKGNVDNPNHPFCAFPVEKVNDRWEPKAPTKKQDYYYVKRLDTSSWLSQTFLVKDYYKVQGNFYFKNSILRAVTHENTEVQKYKTSSNKIKDIYSDFTKVEPLINKIQADLEKMMRRLVDLNAPLVCGAQKQIEMLDRYLGVELRKIINAKNDLIAKISATGQIDMNAENKRISEQKDLRVSAIKEDAYELIYHKPVEEEKVDEKEEYFTHWESKALEPIKANKKKDGSE